MRTRPASKEDLAAIAEVFGSVEEAVLNRPSTLDAVAVADWTRTVSLENDTWLVERDGVLVGAAIAELRDGCGDFEGAVHPSAWGEGIGTGLVELAEARLIEEGAERLRTWAVEGDAGAAELFRFRRYAEVRRFWDMAIDLEGDIPEPDAPIRSFREEDAPAFHATLEEAFKDHWDHHDQAFEEWWSWHRAREAYDPSLWFVIADGDEMAAAIRNDGNYLGGGFVGALGVRRPWRGRGYGRALLLHSFRELQRRGVERVGLVVDATNTTGATRLYESVGMHVELETVVWEKRLS